MKLFLQLFVLAVSCSGAYTSLKLREDRREMIRVNEYGYCDGTGVYSLNISQSGAVSERCGFVVEVTNTLRTSMDHAAACKILFGDKSSVLSVDAPFHGTIFGSFVFVCTSSFNNAECNSHEM